MNVESTYEIGFTKSAIIFNEAAANMPTNVAPVVDYTPYAYSPWGGKENNQLPYQMRLMIEGCGVLSAILNAQATIGVGKGLQPFILKNITADGTEEVEWVNDTEILDWLDENDMYKMALDFTFDKMAYGWRTGSFLLNAAGDRINKVVRKDVFTCRLGKYSDKGVIDNVYISNNWDKNISTQTPEPSGGQLVTIPALIEGFEYDCLNQLRDSNDTRTEFAFIDRLKRNGRQYYPTPLWYAAKEWVKVAMSVPAQKNAIFKNQILLKYKITIHKQFWVDKVDAKWDSLEPDVRKSLQNTIYDQIDGWLTGTSNAGKSLFTGSFTVPGDTQPTDYIKVEAIDDKFADGKLLPDSSAANVEICIATLMNPAFLGAGSVGSATHGSQSGGSNIRESLQTQIMMQEQARKEVSNIMNIVKRFNGWDKRFESKGRLVFRFQSSLLTTLDTGKSTKTENL